MAVTPSPLEQPMTQPATATPEPTTRQMRTWLRTWRADLGVGSRGFLSAYAVKAYREAHGLPTS